jgi:hypothetical protein
MIQAAWLPPLHRCAVIHEVKRALGFGRLIHTDVSIPVSGADGGVSQQRLDEPDIGAGLMEMCGKGMPLMPSSA